MTAKWLIALASFSIAGCVVTTESKGPLHYESQAVERDSAELVRVNLNMSAGDLKVSSGTKKLMQAYFNYNVPELKPEVHYSSAAGTSDLRVEQPSHHAHIGNMKYEWDLRLSDQVPLDIHVNFGAGEAQLDLGSLDLRGVELDMGVGELNMDLRGNPKHDYNVRVRGDVGEATVRLPGSVGVEARAAGGIGDISVRGLIKQNNYWRNEAFDKPGVKIHVDVQGGVGSIKLISD